MMIRRIRYLPEPPLTRCRAPGLLVLALGAVVLLFLLGGIWLLSTPERVAGVNEAGQFILLGNQSGSRTGVNARERESARKTRIYSGSTFNFERRSAVDRCPGTASRVGGGRSAGIRFRAS